MSPDFIKGLTSLHSSFSVISFSQEDASDEDIDHGMLVVLNVDSSIPNEELHRIFGAYGEIKQVKTSFLNLNSFLFGNFGEGEQ